MVMLVQWLARWAVNPQTQVQFLYITPLIQDRLTVGHQVLTLEIMVRIHVLDPIHLRNYYMLLNYK